MSKYSQRYHRVQEKILCSNRSGHKERYQINGDGNGSNYDAIGAFGGFSDNSFDSNDDARHDCEPRYSQPPPKSLNEED